MEIYYANGLGQYCVEFCRTQTEAQWSDTTPLHTLYTCKSKYQGREQ